MTDPSQRASSSDSQDTRTKSKFIDVNAADDTGEISRPIPRPPFVSSTEEINKSSLRKIINAIGVAETSGMAGDTDGVGPTVRLRSEFTLVADTLPIAIAHKRRRTRFYFFR